jgi:hypothetical protein
LLTKGYSVFRLLGSLTLLDRMIVSGAGGLQLQRCHTIVVAWQRLNIYMDTLLSILFGTQGLLGTVFRGLAGGKRLGLRSIAGGEEASASASFAKRGRSASAPKLARPMQVVIPSLVFSSIC